MKNILTTLFLAIACIVNAQKSPIKFGDIPMDDLKMAQYPQDTTAEAVILEDFGHAYITVTAVQATLQFERHVRIKILKKEGLSWANAAIRVFHNGSDEERISNLKAASYTLADGKLVETKMEKSSTFKERINKYFNNVKFTIPNAQVGSVIEYAYTIHSDFLSNFPNWRFQYSIPTRHTEYWASIPNVFIFEKYMQGYVSVTDYQVRDQNSASLPAKVHHWTMKDVPAFKPEPFMTCEDDFFSKINFALAYIDLPNQPTKEVMGTWEKLNADLLESEDFGRAIERTAFLKDKALELTAGITEPQKKLEAIHTYVKKNIEWDGEKDYLLGNPKKIMEEKKGTSGDINIIMASMLQKVGFDVDMVLLSTRDHGFIREQFPMRRQFNYVVCGVNVDGKRHLLDATEPLLPYNVLPERCLNGRGFVVSATKSGWTPIVPGAKERHVVNSEFTLTEDGELKGQVTQVHEGYGAYEARQALKKHGEKDYVKNYSARQHWAVEKSELTGHQEINMPAREVLTVSIGDHAVVAGDVIYLSPFVQGQLTENPFRSETREYPIDFGTPREKVIMTKIKLPPGYQIEEPPANKVIALPGNAARYMFSFTKVSPTEVMCVSNFQISRNLFSQEEYVNLREFYNQVVAKQAEQITIKKVGP
jgi:hypothetical protein